MNKKIGYVKENKVYATKEEFEAVLKKDFPIWYEEVYEWLSVEEKDSCFSNYEFLTEFNYDGNIESWGQFEILINLNIFSIEECAVALGALVNKISEYDWFDVINSFPKGFEEKILALICFLDFRWYVFPWEVIYRVVDYFDKFTWEKEGDKRIVLETVFIDCDYTHCPDEDYVFNEDYFLIINSAAAHAVEEYLTRLEECSTKLEKLIFKITQARHRKNDLRRNKKFSGGGEII